MKIKIFLALVGTYFMSAATWASPVTFEIDTKFSGAPQPKEFVATFTDMTGYVELKMENKNDVNANSWYFNLDPSLDLNGASAGTFDCADLSWVSGDTFTSCTSDPASSALKADGDGTFDFRLDFSSFGITETVIYKIMDATLSALDFDFASQPPTGGAAGPLYAAVKAPGGGAWWGDGINNNCGDDRNEPEACNHGNGEPTPMPEPGSLALLGIGLAGLGFARRRRKI